MSRHLMTGMLGLVLSAALATVTFAAPGAAGQSGPGDTGMSSGTGQSDSLPDSTKKSKKSSESSLGIEQSTPGQGAQGQGMQDQGTQSQGAQGLGGQTDSPVKGLEKSPEGKSRFGERGSGQGSGGGAGVGGLGQGR